MKSIYTLLFLFPLLTANILAQNIAERLGYEEDAKLLIVHADDLGVAHSVNDASIKAFKGGGITSASIMVPCPWFPEIAAYASDHPEYCWGLHLTLTAEWKHYKWDGCSSSNEIQSILTDRNQMYAKVMDVVSNYKISEVEEELRCQIERAFEFGVSVTHLDSHMGTLFSNEELFQLYVSLGNEYRLPVLIPGPMVPASWNIDSLLGPYQQPVNQIIMLQETSDNPTEVYNKMMDKCVPGLNELIIHLGHNNDELQAVMVDHPSFGSEWRQNDLEYVMSNEFRKKLVENDIQLTSWKEIKNALGK